MCGRLGTCETKGIEILLLQAYWRSIHFDHTASVKHLKSVIVGTVEPLIWQWWIQERGPAPSPLILDQNEARMAEKFFFGRSPPPATYLKVWGTVFPPPPPPPLFRGKWQFSRVSEPGFKLHSGDTQHSKCDWPRKSFVAYFKYTLVAMATAQNMSYLTQIYALCLRELNTKSQR